MPPKNNKARVTDAPKMVLLRLYHLKTEKRGVQLSRNFLIINQSSILICYVVQVHQTEFDINEIMGSLKVHCNIALPVEADLEHFIISIFQKITLGSICQVIFQIPLSETASVTDKCFSLLNSNFGSVVAFSKVQKQSQMEPIHDMSI